MGILNQDYVSSFYHYFHMYTLPFKPNCLLQKYFLLKQMKQTKHQVSCHSLLNHGNFSAGLFIKQGSPQGSLQRFSYSSLQLNGSIFSPFPELTEKELGHRLVQNCLHSRLAVEQLHSSYRYTSMHRET